MTQIKEYPTASSLDLRRVLQTGGSDVSSLASSHDDSEERWAGWQEVIDVHLLEWGRNPAVLEDEDVEAPSPEIISLACQTAAACRDAGWTPPTRVIPNGVGGIVFERRDGPIYEAVEVRADGSVEVMSFNNSRLTFRGRMG